MNNTSNNRKKIIKLNENKVILEFNNLEFYNITKINYDLVKDIKYVPKMEFINNRIEILYCGKNLNLSKLNIKEKEIIKKQIVEFIKELYKINVAHRDLHTKNICWDGKQMWVIDWEFAIKHTPKKITTHYDLCGKGLTSPFKTGKMNIFKNHKNGIKNWLNPVKINLEDFNYE